MSAPRRGSIEECQTTLYRHCGEGGELLYVGISLNAFYRLHQHGKSAHWTNSIKNVTIENFATRAEALAAEELAIKTERPKHNIVFNGKMQERNVRPRPKFALPSIKKLGAPKIKRLAERYALPPAPDGDAWIAEQHASIYIGYRALPQEDARMIVIERGKVERGARLYLKSKLDKKVAKLGRWHRERLEVIRQSLAA